MPIEPRPASELLKNDGGSRPTWARFDAAWYRARYPDCGQNTDDDTLAFFVTRGQSLGHSPNPLFDEEWVLATYPLVAANVRSGKAQSGFDAFCRGAFLGRSPHWLYDDKHYLGHSGDLNDKRLRELGFWGPFDHFLRHGDAETRAVHTFFEARHYLAGLSATDAAVARLSPWRHCVSRLRAAVETPTTVLFDAAWYRAHDAEARAALAAGTTQSALQHYLTNGAPGAHDPSALFSERYYLANEPDIAAAVAQGQWRNGYMHFLAHGAAELRRPSPALDLRYYVGANPGVAVDIAERRVLDAYRHYLRLGAPAGAAPLPPGVIGLPEEAPSVAAARATARAVAATVARAPLDFSPRGEPALSVVMVLRDGFALTLAALAALRHDFQGPIELFLADSGSQDETRRIADYVRGAHLLRFDEDVGFVAAANAAIEATTAPAVLFLDNTVTPCPGAIHAALRRLDGDASAGAVGGRVLRPNGLLREAGCIVWRDGSTQAYLRDEPADRPEALFTRRVDFCSSAFLLVRASVLRALRGFDPDCASARYEDADLCLRVAKAGLYVIYDPAILVRQSEPGSAHGTPTSDVATVCETFPARHAEVLAGRPVRNAAAVAAARQVADRKTRILFIDDAVPLRQLGDRHTRSNDIVRALTDPGSGLAAHVTVFPLDGCRCDTAAIVAGFPDRAEILFDRDAAALPTLLDERIDVYDFVWIVCARNLRRVAAALRAWQARHVTPPRVVLDMPTLESLRDALRARTDGIAFDIATALQAELAGSAVSDVVVAITDAEADVMYEQGLKRVLVLGHTGVPSPTPRGFDARAGLMFVGAAQHATGDTLDSLSWFASEVLPRVAEADPAAGRLSVFGFRTPGIGVAPGIGLGALRDDPRVDLRDMVGDTAAAYDAHRVFVAPTRFTSGLPYEVHEAALRGVPVVATPLLAQQLGWTHERDLLTAPADDPAAFADCVLRLHNDSTLWRRLRENGLRRATADLDPEAFGTALQRVMLAARK